MKETILPNQTSSIGAAWPPVEASFERQRGFYMEGVVGPDHASVADFTEQYRDQRSFFGRVHSETGLRATRLSVRAVVASTAVRQIAQLMPVEAAIPLGGEHQGHHIVYVGANTTGRDVHSNIIDKHRQRLAEVIDGNLPSPITQADLTSRNIEVSTVRPEQSAEYLDQFCELYRSFGYDRKDTEELLENPDNTIVFARDVTNGDVVSSAMAEHASIEIAGMGELSIVEITEAITRPDQRGRGLYRVVSGLLTDELVDQSKNGESPIHAIYGESNLAAVGVLRAAYQNGRRFSAFDGQELGIDSPRFGILPQNFSVQDGIEQRPYNDFAVSYVPL